MAEQKTAVRGRPFKPGVSGNPGGKPKMEHHVSTLARAHTPEAIKALVLALKSPRERVPAAIALLDRGWGKPVQMVMGDPDRPVSIEFQWSDAHTNTDAVKTIEHVVNTVVDTALNDDAAALSDTDATNDDQSDK